MEPVAHITPKRSHFIWAFCLLAAVIAAGASAVILRNGIKIPSDGWAYWEGSVSLLHGRGYYHFTGRRIWSWPPGYPLYLAACQSVGGVSGATLARANTLLAAVAAFAWTAAFLLPFRRALDSARAARPLTLTYPLLAVIFIALTIATGFRTAMAHNLVYTLYPLVLYVTFRAVQPEGRDRGAIGLALLNAVLMSLLIATHYSFIFFPPLVAAVTLLHRGRRPAIRMLAAGVMCIIPLAAWVILAKSLGQWANHKPGSRPLFTWSQYAHQVLTGVANLFGPGRHHLGQMLLVGACVVIAVCLLRGRFQENAARRVVAMYLLLSAGFLGCLYVAFNTIAIAEPLYSERFMLFVPLTIFPAAAMLFWQSRWETLRAARADDRPARPASPALGRLVSVLGCVLLVAIPLAAAGRTLHWAREARINGGPVDLARAARDQGFGYNRLTLDYRLPDGPPRFAGDQILVAPAREVPAATTRPATSSTARR